MQLRICLAMTNFENTLDEDLAVLLKQGNHAAYTEIYNRYWQVLFIHSMKMLRDEEEALDVLQNIFVNLWLHASTITIKTSLRSYLYKMTRNQTLNTIEKSNTRNFHFESFSRYIEMDRPLTEESVNFNELSTRIEAEVSKLPPKMRAIFEKSRFDGLSHKEIAKELNVSENTVKTVLHRATKSLREKLGSLIFFMFF